EHLDEALRHEIRAVLERELHRRAELDGEDRAVAAHSASVRREALHAASPEEPHDREHHARDRPLPLEQRGGLGVIVSADHGPAGQAELVAERQPLRHGAERRREEPDRKEVPAEDEEEREPDVHHLRRLLEEEREAADREVYEERDEPAAEDR